MINKYSIVIHPEISIIGLFKSYKDILFSKIGSYGSRNSLAHTTILEFDATEDELLNYIDKIIKIAQKEVPFAAVFNNIIYSKAILVLPNENDANNFKHLLKKVRKNIHGYSNKSAAHLTIGRRLDPEQIKNSQSIFENINFDFNCCQFALRKFNHRIGQYEIINVFPFLGESPKEESSQLSLF